MLNEINANNKKGNSTRSSAQNITLSQSGTKSRFLNPRYQGCSTAILAPAGNLHLHAPKVYVCRLAFNERAGITLRALVTASSTRGYRSTLSNLTHVHELQPATLSKRRLWRWWRTSARTIPRLLVPNSFRYSMLDQCFIFWLSPRWRGVCATDFFLIHQIP